MNMMKNKEIGIISLLICMVVSSCTGEKKQNITVDEKPLVRLEAVKKQAVEQIQEFTATVEADVVNNISSSMSLRINDILVEVGDHVHKGQILAQMDKTNLLQSKSTGTSPFSDFYKPDGSVFSYLHLLY